MSEVWQYRMHYPDQPKREVKQRHSLGSLSLGLQLTAGPALSAPHDSLLFSTPARLRPGKVPLRELENSVSFQYVRHTSRNHRALRTPILIPPRKWAWATQIRFRQDSCDLCADHSFKAKADIRPFRLAALLPELMLTPPALSSIYVHYGNSTKTIVYLWWCWKEGI